MYKIKIFLYTIIIYYLKWIKVKNIVKKNQALKDGSEFNIN